MIIRSGDLQFVLEGGTRWTFVLKNLRPDTPDRRVPDTRISVFRREVDGPPSASFTVDANEDDGTVTITDTSTDAVGVASIEIDWGDGTVDPGLAPGGTYMHTYATTGTYTITLTATDTSGQADTASQDVGVTVLWTPAELGAKLVQWQDARTTSSVTIRTDAGTDYVERWADLSGNGYDWTQSQAVQQFEYDGTALISDGTDDTMLTALPTGQTYQMFWVLETSDPRMIYPSATIDNTRYGWVGDDGSTNTTIQNYGTTGVLRINAETTTPLTRDDVHALHVTGSAVLAEHDPADLTEQGQAWSQEQVGGYSGAVDFFMAARWSARVVTTTLTSAERDLVEGYLAHRYGIASRLPPGHPYEDNPPTI